MSIVVLCSESSIESRIVESQNFWVKGDLRDIQFIFSLLSPARLHPRLRFHLQCLTKQPSTLCLIATRDRKLITVNDSVHSAFWDIWLGSPSLQ